MNSTQKKALEDPVVASIAEIRYLLGWMYGLATGIALMALAEALLTH